MYNYIYSELIINYLYLMAGVHKFKKNGFFIIKSKVCFKCWDLRIKKGVHIYGLLSVFVFKLELS